MDDERAKQAIEQILAKFNIETVVCVDDIYVIYNTGDFDVEFAIGWFSEAKSHGKTEDCKAILPGIPFDAEDEVWKRALRDDWTGLDKQGKICVLDALAKTLNHSDTNISREFDSASLLKCLIPRDMLRELGPAKWEEEKDVILRGLDGEKGLLCLFDHNLQWFSPARWRRIPRVIVSHSHTRRVDYMTRLRVAYTTRLWVDYIR